MENIQSKYDVLQKMYNELLDENRKLKHILNEHGIDIPQKIETASYSSKNFLAVKLSLGEKITLFRSIFRGREDVFARRWYSKTSGKSGYQPVCLNEWRQGICDKKRYKCCECLNRSFAKLSDDFVYRHLEGKDENCCDVIGLYPMMSDNTCFFLSVDFDDKSCEHGYQNDVKAFVSVCNDWKIPFSIERSRSGNGAHVWIFFESAISAIKSRRLGNAILTEAMNRDGCLSFNSYDRLFPNQDLMPDGGFGNLIALPLQGKARRMGNSVFVDNEFMPYSDQWAYLYQVKKISERTVDDVLANCISEDLGALSTSSEKRPWILPTIQNITEHDFVPDVKITKADKIYIPLKSVSSKVINHLKRIAAFKNPEFYSKQAMRLSTYSTPRIISCADISDDYIAIPRGCEEEIVKLFNNFSVRYSITDETNHGVPISVRFNGQEREEQLDAIRALLSHNCGVLSATTAFGKTVTAASIIARRKVNVLILVHTKSLLEQWFERLTSFLDIDYVEPDKSKGRGRKKKFSPIGLLDSTGNSLHGMIDIALIQSCLSDGEVKPFVQDYGMVIVDECHHVSSVTFENVLKCVRAQYVYGLTATPVRKDGHQPIIFMQCGPIRFSADAKSQIEKQSFQRYLIPRFTSFRSIGNNDKTFVSLCRDICEDDLRNKMIVDDVCKAIEKGRTPIILTNRKMHVEILCEMLLPYIDNVVRLTGTGTAKEKRETMKQLNELQPTDSLVVVATGKYVGEGFDYPRLDTLILASPISWKGLLAQYAGRLHRENEGKLDVRIYDYIDIHEPLLESMYHKRLKGYASIGYKALNKLEPSLFEDYIDVTNITDRIFTGKRYIPYLKKDLSVTKRSVIVSSPRLYNIESSHFLKILHEMLCNGVEVVIFTKDNNESAKYMISKGFSVNVSSNLSICCTIIDKSTIWYGSFDPLGYIEDNDSVIRISDSSIAGGFIEVIYNTASL